VNGAPTVGAVQVITTFVPELIVTGEPGAVGTAKIVILAPLPKLSDDVVP
jgi:hypothetical protein